MAQTPSAERGASRLLALRRGAEAQGRSAIEDLAFGALLAPRFLLRAQLLGALVEVGERRAQVFSNGAADAAVVELDDLLPRILDQDLVVDVLLAELVLDDGDLLAVGFGQDFPVSRVRVICPASTVAPVRLIAWK